MHLLDGITEVRYSSSVSGVGSITYLRILCAWVEKVVQHLYDKDKIAESRAKAPDVKESFECGREDDPEMPNIWLPEGIFPGFNEACLEFYWVCCTSLVA